MTNALIGRPLIARGPVPCRPELQVHRQPCDRQGLHLSPWAEKDQLGKGTIATTHIKPALAGLRGDPVEKYLPDEAAPDPHEAVVTGPIGEADRFTSHALGCDGVRGCTGPKV